MMRRGAAMATAVLCGLLVAGCGGAGAPGTGAGTGKTPGGGSSWSRDGGGTPSAPATPQPSATPPPASAPPPTHSLPPQGKRLVAATVSGGIDGRHRSVLVNEDGTYTVLDRKKPPKKARMPADRLAELRSALAESDFARLPRISVADPPVMDGIMTAVIYRGHEVATDGMRKLPRLDRVIAALPGLN
jgi:hypothetical protein